MHPIDQYTDQYRKYFYPCERYLLDLEYSTTTIEEKAANAANNVYHTFSLFVLDVLLWLLYSIHVPIRIIRQTSVGAQHQTK